MLRENARAKQNPAFYGIFACLLTNMKKEIVARSKLDKSCKHLVKQSTVS